MPQIADFITLGNVAVPRDARGYYLDWRSVRGDQAERLVSPYGPDTFRVGNRTLYATVNFAELPNGEFILEAEDRHRLLHVEDHYNVETRGGLVEAVYHLTENILDALERQGAEHNTFLYEADAWYAFRAASQYLGVRPYDLFSPVELQLGYDPTDFE